MEFKEFTQTILRRLFIVHPFIRATKRIARKNIFEASLLPFPPSISSEYERIKVSPKISDQHLRKRLDALECIAKKHDEKRQELLSKMSTLSVDSALKTLETHGIQSLDEYQDFLQEILRLKHQPSWSSNYVRRMKLLFSFPEKALKEAKICLEASALLDLDKRKYIDAVQADSIKSELADIKKQYEKDPLYISPFPSGTPLEERIPIHNDDFIRLKQSSPSLKDINGHELDHLQKIAVISDEPNILVLAGAGTGKTLTICGKVSYLLREEGIKPEEILLLSYSRKSADDLQAKVDSVSSEVKAATFHEIGLNVLKQSSGVMPTVNEQYDAIIEEFFRVEMLNNEEIQLKILHFYSLYYYSQSSCEETFENLHEYYEALKSDNLSTLKDLLAGSPAIQAERYTTFKKELVKSREELAIANWYFLHGIDYEYERPFEKNVSNEYHRQYRPDFTLDNGKIYHEHYGVNRDGKAPQFGKEASEKYQETMKWKRNLHAETGTNCIETFSYEFKEGTVFDRLKEELEKRGLHPEPFRGEDLANTLNFVCGRNNFSQLKRLFKTFINLYKSNYADDKEFDAMRKTLEKGNNYEAKRGLLFIDIAEAIYHYYIKKIRSEDSIDFDDMILQATNALPHIAGHRYKYILVDEFQDISHSRFLFLKALIEKGSSRLFAVGDDYQSIYRFSGSELSLFTHFTDHFPHAKIMRIERTYRNPQRLIDIAGSFIDQNPFQFKKTLVSSAPNASYPIRIVWIDDELKEAFESVLEDISSQNPNANIFILGRYKADIKPYLEQKLLQVSGYHPDNVLFISPAFPGLRFHYSTIHASKGLEEEYVILLNLSNAVLGFPNQMEDDPLLGLILREGEAYPFDEERRLFYVALTRAKKAVYLLVPSDRPSIFVREISSQCIECNPRNEPQEEDLGYCPHCHGKLRILDGRERPFVACSNFPYCRYTNNNVAMVRRGIRCPRCGDFLTVRRKNGERFIGCHNYPNCTFTFPLPKKEK